MSSYGFDMYNEIRLLNKTLITYGAFEVFQLLVNFLVNSHILRPREGLLAKPTEEGFF